ncbi:MAG: hypothetical protein GXP49_00575 [Deltaproteobacteria bacterium]|nr:hypothetical protein [Deltaproteobacteria bacterium]
MSIGEPLFIEKMIYIKEIHFLSYLCSKSLDTVRRKRLDTLVVCCTYAISNLNCERLGCGVFLVPGHETGQTPECRKTEEGGFIGWLER